MPHPVESRPSQGPRTGSPRRRQNLTLPRRNRSTRWDSARARRRLRRRSPRRRRPRTGRRVPRAAPRRDAPGVARRSPAPIPASEEPDQEHRQPSGLEQRGVRVASGHARRHAVHRERREREHQVAGEERRPGGERDLPTARRGRPRRPRRPPHAVSPAARTAFTDRDGCKRASARPGPPGLAAGPPPEQRSVCRRPTSQCPWAQRTRCRQDDPSVMGFSSKVTASGAHATRIPARSSRSWSS